MSTTSSVAEPAPARAAAPKVAPVVNDLAIRVGTVNGSGSQSANLVLLRSLYAMGIPCSGKNIFPSNIEGLPTWFHIRASARGYGAHRADPDILVCMNEITAQDDVSELKPGAICLYREDFSVDLPSLRDDVTFLAAPFYKLVEQAYPPDKTDKGYRDKLRKVVNMVYVGVLASICRIDMEAVEQGVRREFPGRKAKAAEINIAAVHTGYEWAQANLPTNLPYRVERMESTQDKILIEGNKAAALGVLFGGTSVLTWYPITPSSSLAEYAEGFLKQHRTDAEGRKSFAVIQAEDELAAIGMAIGAGWAGARALTATSGPGISLMTEFVGMGYFAEIPVVIIDVQRMGPSTGLPTRTSQGDVLKMHLLGHGDCRHIVLMPGSVEECYELVIEALDLAQQFQTPVFVATDLDLGMNLWLSEPFRYPDKPLQRGKLLNAADLERIGEFARYKDVDGDGVCYRTIPGTENPMAAYFTRGTGHNEKSGYSERPEDWKKNLDRLALKLETARKALPAPIIEGDPSAQVGLLAYGGSHVAMAEARDQLQEQGVRTGYCRIRALPVSDEVTHFIERHQRVYVIEQNRDAQVTSLLKTTLRGTIADRLVPVTHYSGTPISAENIVRPILGWEKNPSGPGWPTGDVERDNPHASHVEQPSSE
ncbi:MAG: 2-oxoacid:acceptor oxidoreductase subunit alpha [Paludisphaera borealis]|uniref:2-oxoacid:acceptor oxidoreductase subunit alpha n=1 Tax=Paludisphaera borealis TaxID=1387353 RepID=UPI00284A39EC|nr:2-oxoacid:acceptor oxidoreductase subunit alpha [Paludisphaera borealis]MDR3622729.1 2-oxoacid:acceptor oxidoreductase subunit alpha [Paludisphaera borealis]